LSELEALHASLTRLISAARAGGEGLSDPDMGPKDS
jgi:hypothetical protein